MLRYTKNDTPTQITLEPSKTPVGSIIWLHGLGADGHDFVPIVEELNLPDTLPLRFIFPHAPVRPVTINNGFAMRAWFDIYSMNIQQKIDHEGINHSIRLVHDLIAHEQSLNIPTDRIILAGFSQGSMIAMATALTYPQKLAGVIALSGFLPNVETLMANIPQRTTPFFIGHGSDDTVVPFLLGEMTADALTKAGFPVTFKKYPMAHAVCAEEIMDIAQWLSNPLSR